MRYVVKYSDGKEIHRAYATNDLTEAVSKQFELIDIYGEDNVWIADSVQEILIG